MFTFVIVCYNCLVMFGYALIWVDFGWLLVWMFAGMIGGCFMICFCIVFSRLILVYGLLNWSLGVVEFGCVMFGGGLPVCCFV